MTARTILTAATLLLLPLGGVAAKDFTSLHPEQSIPDSKDSVSAGPYNDFIKRVQEKLHAQGFDAGPVNGDFGAKTQAALAQFQLSQTLPASGQLDDPTLGALGLQREPSASAAPSAEADRVAQERPLSGSCDSLAGPEKERCLKQGGTVEASVPAGTGASRPASSQ